MTTYDLEILIRTKKTGDDPSPPPDSGLKWTELKSKVDLAKQAFSTAAAAVKVAYGALKEGAELEAARGRFDNLTKTINTTGDALLGKLKEATKGMVSDAELIAGASDIISLGLAKNEGDTVRLATAVSTLGLDMQQVILTFANNSKARLDSLGLSVEGVTQKAAELERQGFQGDAFDEAVLIGLEEKMELLGDASQTTAGKLAILESSWANLTNQLKEGAAGAVEPAISLLVSLGEYGDQVDTIIAANVESAKSFEDLVAEAAKIDEVNNIMGGLGTTVTGTSGDVRDGLLDVTRNLATSASGFEEFEAVIASWSAKSQQQFYSYLRANNLTIEGFYELERRLESHTARQAEEAAAVQASIEALQAKAAALVELADEERAAAHGSELLASQSDQLNEQMERTAAVADGAADRMAYLAEQDEIAAAARARLVEAFEASEGPINDLFAAQEDLAAAEGEWVTRTVSTAGQVSAINAQLAADLSGEQKAAYQDILKTVDEGSAEWLAAYSALQNDLTDSQRQALIAQQADLASQPDSLANVYTGDAAAAEEAQARIAAANEAIQQSYRETAAEALLAQNGVTEATLDTLVAIGYMTQEQADARLEFANTTTAIETLAASSEYAALTADEQATALNALIEGTAKTAEEAVNLATQQTLVNDALNAMPKAVVSTVTVRGLDEAGSRIGDLLRQLDALDGRNVSATATINTFTNEDLGGGGGTKEAPKKALGGPFAAGKLYRVGEGNLPEIGMIQSSGKLFMIPGERGQVFGNSQAGRMIGGGFTDNSQISIVNNNLEAAATTNALVQERRRASMDAYMGVE